MFTRRKQNAAVPVVGAEAPEFNLPSAQGGQLRLGMRTACGPVVVVFFRGTWSEEDIAYFETLSKKEDEINLSGASVVGIGAVEPDEAREFVRASGIKSMVLYDYAKITTRQWGLSERDKEHGEYARPAVFIVGTDHEVVHAWTDGRPSVDEIMTRNRRRCPPKSGSASRLNAGPPAKPASRSRRLSRRRPPSRNKRRPPQRRPKASKRRRKCPRRNARGLKPNGGRLVRRASP